MSRRGRRGRARSEGFTLIEIMVAVGLMTVGAMAIMAMQQATTRGNMEARRVTTASQITSRWIERLRRDALLWTEPTTVSVQGSTYLSSLVNDTTDGLTTGWIYPDTSVAGADPNDSAGYDWVGMPVDLDANAENARYCTMVRMTWLRTGITARVDVLTWWHRTGGGGDDTYVDATLHAGCTDQDAIIGDLDTSSTVLRSVRASTVLRWTQRDLLVGGTP